MTDKRDSAIGPTHCPSIRLAGSWIEWSRGRACEGRRGECDLFVFGGGMLGHGHCVGGKRETVSALV
jgi:hypothetical protein